MAHLKKINSFDSIINRLENIFPNQSCIETLYKYQTFAGDYPLLKIVLGKGNQRRALISAGIHGDEPGGVEAILNFLANEAPFINEWEITFLPCINPYGYEFGIRENHEGKDLNRLFKEADPPIEVVFAKSVFARAFELTLELHEDDGSHGYYLYQKGINAKYDGFGLEILNSVKNIMPTNLDDEIDGSAAYQGVIGKDMDISSMDWWPMALYGVSQGTQISLTLEAAGCFNIETRINAHLTAIKTVLTTFNKF